MSELDVLVPERLDEQGDWARVVRDARHRSRRAWTTRAAAVALLAVAAFAAVLAWPSSGPKGSILDRALAAVGNGPVLHVVLRGESGGTLIDLESGARASVHAENEIWFDSDRGVVHFISRLGGVAQYEYVREPKEPPAELVALGREYRQALESGSARVAGEGTIDGEPVVWITIRSEMLPDVADGKDHEWAQQVAVSRRTFKPVALRETRDGEPGPQTGQRVLELELLPAGEGDFTVSEADSVDGTAFSEGREPMPIEQAKQILGQTPLWLGREHAGLPLAEVFQTTSRTSRRREIRLTGKVARAAEACGRLHGREAGRCYRAIGYRGSFAMREDGVFTYGAVEWERKTQGILLFYGTIGDDPSTYREDAIPLRDRPHVAIEETMEPMPFRRGAGRYVPPEGSLFIAAGGRLGYLRLKGLHISIEGSSDELTLSAARALKPMAN